MKLSPLIVDLANNKLDHLFSEKNWINQKNKREKKTVSANLFTDENYQRFGYISHTATIMHGNFIEELYRQTMRRCEKSFKITLAT